MQHIIGSTFNKVCVYKNELDVPQDITNIDIKAQIYTLDNILLATLVVTKIAPLQGSFRLRSESVGWIAGPAIFDIRFVINGDIAFTDTTKLTLIDSFTKPV